MSKVSARSLSRRVFTDIVILPPTLNIPSYVRVCIRVGKACSCHVCGNIIRWTRVGSAHHVVNLIQQIYELFATHVGLRFSPFYDTSAMSPSLSILPIIIFTR